MLPCNFSLSPDEEKLMRQARLTISLLSSHLRRNQLVSLSSSQPFFVLQSPLSSLLRTKEGKILPLIIVSYHILQIFATSIFEPKSVCYTMSDLLSTSFRSRDGGHSHAIELSSDGSGAGVNLDKFFEDAESIKDELKEQESLHQRLQSSHEHSETLQNARAVKDLRAWMEWDVEEAMKKAKAVKVRLEAFERANAANQNFPGRGTGSSLEQTRTSVVNGLRKKSKDNMEGLNQLREKLSSEYKETVKQRYFAVTGENPDESIVDLLTSTGESETFLRKAMQGQGRAGVLDAIREIRERHDTVQ